DDKDKKDKKDKKEEDDKKDKKDKKDAKDKKKKKDAVQLNQKEKLQVQNLIKNMIYGESGKNKTITTGWVNLVDEKDIPRLTPWEFQLAHIMRTSMALEYSAKKKKEVPDLNLYYEMCQSLADAIGLIKKQYSFEFPQNSLEDILPLQDALALQTRFREGSVAGAKFDLLWYLQNGAHLLAGSGFAKKHRTTVFKPFKIQELMIDAILQPGPQLVFGIAPPGTGKTAVVSHIL
ncbi:abfD, partial [Symbiodinium necroappetens]